MILNLECSGTGDVVELEDEAARTVTSFVAAGVDRQAFMEPLMEILANRVPHPTRGDPIAGYAERLDALEAVKELN